MQDFWGHVCQFNWRLCYATAVWIKGQSMLHKKSRLPQCDNIYVQFLHLDMMDLKHWQQNDVGLQDWLHNIPSLQVDSPPVASHFFFTWISIINSIP